MPDPNPSERLAEIEARVKAAHPGPWAVIDGGIGHPNCDTACIAEMVCAPSEGNAAFLAHAREDIPWLLEQVREARLSRWGILPFPCPICSRLRMEYEATADGRLLVRCTKCGADHDTICDAALADSGEASDG